MPPFLCVRKCRSRRRCTLEEHSVHLQVRSRIGIPHSCVSDRLHFCLVQNLPGEQLRGNCGDLCPVLYHHRTRPFSKFHLAMEPTHAPQPHTGLLFITLAPAVAVGRVKLALRIPAGIERQEVSFNVGLVETVNAAVLGREAKTLVRWHD